MIFFDIDGTLLDQRRAEEVSAQQFLSRCSHSFREPSDVETFCVGWRTAREKHAPAWFRGEVTYEEYHRRRIRDVFLDPAISDADCDDLYASFLAEYQSAWVLFEDVLPCLDALNDVSLGIIANGNSRVQRQKLEAMGILERFSVIVVSEDVGAAKPHRRIFREACRRAGQAPGRCWYLGDRLRSDARASCAAGLKGIWLDRDRGGAPEGIEAIHSLEELFAVLEPDVASRCSATGIVLP